MAGPRGDIQQPRATTDRGGVEQRLNESGGDLANEVVVRAGLFLPARRLESVEGVRVDRGLGHCLTLCGTVVADNDADLNLQPGRSRERQRPLRPPGNRLEDLTGDW